MYLLPKKTSFLTSFLALAVAVFTAYYARAGVIVQYAADTDIANNDDFTGPFNSFVNYVSFLNFAGFEHDYVWAVQPSGGTTEYAFNISANFSTVPAEAIYLELGFGVGENFVSAASVFSDLDFDAPLPGIPAPSSDKVWATVNHQAHRIQYSDGLADDVIYGIAEFSIDVPDLPVSVNDFYTSSQLPANLPAGGGVFTLRTRIGLAIPEPSGAALSVLALASITMMIGLRKATKLR
ncbi:hypothetical protein [Bythopirellula polymerisocia]|uniref:PEP-CTERM protein-sorting domain-containing protein n=1 Tax=Bythopirellula polymerisocia TaxID=2528003 RepID=A0A5C6C7Z1_9BACT|nr:hypothetical protein [Bythopirellula polymerisocia]TWU20773.1 hypothetical protein Pla144_48240 [Bythopirellula polymerisocia]